MNLLILGPPGSGKGTQAMKIADKFGLEHLSTGDLLREAIKAGSELGKKAEVYMEKGELLPDSFLISMIEEKIASGQLRNGFILDGFPRTIPQAKSFKEMLDKNNITLDKAVLLEVADEEIIKRLSGRWLCPECNTSYNYPSKVPQIEGRCDNDNADLTRRPDDEEDVVRNRLEIYKQQTEPIIDFYRKESILASVAGFDTPKGVYDSIEKVIA